MSINSQLKCSAAGQAIPNYDIERDGALIISGSTNLADVYYLKGIVDPAAWQLPPAKALLDAIKLNAFGNASQFLQSAKSMFPNLLVSLSGSEGVVQEYLVQRKENWSLLANGLFDKGGSSSDFRAFTDRAWGSLSSDSTGVHSCLIITPNFKMNLFLNVPLDVVPRLKTINLKMVSQ
jgi:hypothetical protein